MERVCALPGSKDSAEVWSGLAACVRGIRRSNGKREPFAARSAAEEEGLPEVSAIPLPGAGSDLWVDARKIQRLMASAKARTKKTDAVGFMQRKLLGRPGKVKGSAGSADEACEPGDGQRIILLARDLVRGFLGLRPLRIRGS